MKDFGVHPFLFPMPVYMIGTYNEDDTVDSMAMADEKVLDENGKIDCGKLNTFLFDQMRNDYYAVGGVCGKAWHSGAPFLQKES